MKTRDRFPSQIKYIVGQEAAERFSYYGMKAILVVFMMEYLKKAAPDAKATYHFFIQAVFFLPLFGGYIADRFLGKYRTIMTLSIFYCLGHGVLAIWENEAGLYWGLGLIALGAGGIKPCVSSHVGDQFTAKNQHLLARIFSIFYFAINFGGFFSQAMTPWLLHIHGPRLAFGIPGILMALATLVFWLGRKQYVHVPPTGKTGEPGFAAIGWAMLRGTAQKKYSATEIEGARSAWDIFKIFSACSMFWALFDQNGSSWTIQAGQMNLHFMGMELQAAQIQAMNSLMILVLIPIFTLYLYPLIERISGLPFTPLKRMTVGMFLTGASFVWVAILQAYLDRGVSLSVMHQTGPYLIMTAAEILVSVTALEFAYTQAPRSMKSTIMSFWYLTFAAGNFLTAVISKFNFFTGAAEFVFYAALMFAVAIWFAWYAARYKERSYFEKA